MHNSNTTAGQQQAQQQGATAQQQAGKGKERGSNWEGKGKGIVPLLKVFPPHFRTPPPTHLPTQQQVSQGASYRLSETPNSCADSVASKGGWVWESVSVYGTGRA